MSLILIKPLPDSPETSARMDDVLRRALADTDCRVVYTADGLTGLAGNKLLFAVSLDETGMNFEYQRMLARIRRERALFRGCTAGLIVDSASPLYSKSTAAELTFAANLSGCAFLGRPLVEATGSLRNFHTQSKIHGTDLHSAYRIAVAELLERLKNWSPLPPPGRVLALHASMRTTSNTLALWEMVKRNLPETVEIEELNLRNGTLTDCIGCHYTTCLHFGERGECFYGGPMVEEVFPAVRRCDTLVMLCANYNDALSANLTAFVNRLTSLFRQSRFYDKRIYGLVVSGYSGGDLLAQQLISGLNMNKSFYLPPRFVLMETANDKGSLLQQPGVDARGAEFARAMMSV